MGWLLFFLIIVSLTVLIIYLIYYISTLPERRANDEKIKQEIFLYEEKLKAEQAKRDARNAGEIVRETIDIISKL